MHIAYYYKLQLYGTAKYFPKMSEITQNPGSIILTTKPTVAKKLTTKRGGRKTKATAAAIKQQPLKVVYISSPMRIEASAAEFRALVQELTGRDAADWTCPDQIPRAAPDNIGNDRHVLLDGCGGGDDHVTMSGFGSDLGWFGPFDCADDDDDQMVDLKLEDFSSFYGYGCLHQ